MQTAWSAHELRCFSLVIQGIFQFQYEHPDIPFLVQKNKSLVQRNSKSPSVNLEQAPQFTEREEQLCFPVYGLHPALSGRIWFTAIW